MDKKAFLQYVGVNSQSGISPSDKIDILESPKRVFFFFQNRGYFTNERDWFLIFNRKTYKIKMTLLPDQSLVSAVKLDHAFKALL